MATQGDAALHPMAPHYIPGWLPDPASGDPFMTVMIIFVVGLVLGLGVFYLKLHALPEQMAHGTGASQLQLVSVLAILALFTHNNIFWILALLIAGINIPDFLSPLQSIARSLKKLSTSGGSFTASAATTPAEPSDAPEIAPKAEEV